MWSYTNLPDSLFDGLNGSFEPFIQTSKHEEKHLLGYNRTAVAADAKKQFEAEQDELRKTRHLLKTRITQLKDIAKEEARAREDAEKAERQHLLFLIEIAEHGLDEPSDNVWKQLLAALYQSETSDFLIEQLDTKPKVKKTLIGLMQKHHQKLVNASQEYADELKKMNALPHFVANAEAMLGALTIQNKINMRSLREYRDSIRKGLTFANSETMKQTLRRDKSEAAGAFAFVISVIKSIFNKDIGFKRTLSAISHARKTCQSVLFFNPSAKNAFVYRVDKENNLSVKKPR